MSLRNLFQSAISCSISFSFSNNPRSSSVRVPNIFIVSAKFFLMPCNSFILFSDFSAMTVSIVLSSLVAYPRCALRIFRFFYQISHLETRRIPGPSSISKHVGTKVNTNSFTHRFLFPHPRLDGPTDEDCILRQRFNSL